MKRTPLAPMSARRRALFAEAGRRPSSTLDNASGAPRAFLAARPNAAVPAATKDALVVRSGRLCEMQLKGCTGVATDPSHRIARGVGGLRSAAAVAESSRLSNQLHACRSCHQWVTANPAASYALGLTLPHGAKPESEPALYRGHRALLGDEGSVTFVQDGAA